MYTIIWSILVLKSELFPNIVLLKNTAILNSWHVHISEDLFPEDEYLWGLKVQYYKTFKAFCLNSKVTIHKIIYNLFQTATVWLGAFISPSGMVFFIQLNKGVKNILLSSNLYFLAIWIILRLQNSISFFSEV